MYDVGVIGLGAMGAATALAAAKRDLSVVGLEQFGAVHDQGSSHGESRIIRKAYFESPHYVQLAQQAYDAWRDIERDSGANLLTITGGLMIGHPGSEVYEGSLQSARMHGLAHEDLSAADVAERFPTFHLPDHYRAVYEPDTGILAVETAIRTMLDLAAAHGARLHFHTALHHVEPLERGTFLLHTAERSFRCRHLVICAGAWSAKLLGEVAPPLQVERVVQHWFRPRKDTPFAIGNFPVYIVDSETGVSFYGMPPMGPMEAGLKHAFHSVRQPQNIDNFNHQVDEAKDTAPLRAMLDRYLPLAHGELRRHATCMYTSTPDANFVIGQHPHMKDAWIACGFSGHGFKFAPVVGRNLCDWMTGKNMNRAWQMFDPQRFSKA